MGAKLEMDVWDTSRYSKSGGNDVQELKSKEQPASDRYFSE